MTLLSCLFLSLRLLASPLGTAYSGGPAGGGNGSGSLPNRIVANGPAYQTELLALSPTWYAAGSDTNTTAIDLGSAGHNGTYAGTYSQSQASLLFETGRVSVKFGGAASGSIMVGTDTAWSSATANHVSNCFWMKSSASGGTGYWPFMTIYTACCCWFWEDCNTSGGTVRCELASNSPSGSSSGEGTTNVRNGVKHFIALVFDGTVGSGKLTLYIDNVKEVTNSNIGLASIPMNGTNAPLAITAFDNIHTGQTSWDNNTGGVVMQEMAFWSNYSLTDANVQHLWNVGNSGTN